MVIMQAGKVRKSESKSSSKERICLLCGAIFRSVIRLNKHIQAHEDRAVDVKNLHFGVKKEMKEETEVKEEVELKWEETKTEENKKIAVHKCTFCGSLLMPENFAEHLERHYSLMFYEEPMVCEEQGDFARVPEEPAGGAARNTLPEIKYMVCCQCMKRFRSSTLLLRHTEDFHQGRGQIALILD